MQTAKQPTSTRPTPTCPVCALEVASVDLIAHVNTCLHSPTASHFLDDIPSPPSSPSSTTSSPSPSPSPSPSLSLSLSPSSPATHPAPSRHSIPLAIWLSNLGLPKYATGFLRAGYRTLADLLTSAPASEHTLRSECGVTALGARKKILSELSTLRINTTPNSTLDTPTQEKPKAQQKRRIWAIFEPGYRASESPSKRSRFQNTSPPAPSTSIRPSPSARTPGPSSRKPRQHSFSHRVPGTDLTVDSFYAASADPPGSVFFLSHFHSDHYGPLRKNTLPKGGKVHCSAVTGSLVQSMLRVPKEAVRVLPVATQVDLREQGVSVWLYDANHCPGAVVFLFYVWKTGRYVLHSGDCRFDPKIFDRHDKLTEVVSRGLLDYLHLDTTYCDPKYVFPYQASVLEQVVEVAKEEDRRTRGRCLYFFGTYSIGKEKVFFSVAEALNLRIYAGKRKRAILEQCAFGKRLTDRLVNSAGEARVQVVSMMALSAEGLRKYAESNKLNTSFIGRGLAIVFRPTGWTFKGNTAAPSRRNRSTDQAMLYEVPYSEHSSYDELVAFVGWSKPSRVIPTVNARSAEQADKLRKLLGHVDKPLRAVT